MTPQHDPTVNLRRIITKRYNIYTWITVVASGSTLLLWILSDEGTIVYSLAYMTCALSVGTLVRNLTHRNKMLQYLQAGQADPFRRLETYLLEKQSQWRNYMLIRFAMGAITGLSMILLLVFDGDPYWAITSACLFIVLIVANTTLGWINFSDQILLHDIERSHRDQPSNNPE